MEELFRPVRQHRAIRSRHRPHARTETLSHRPNVRRARVAVELNDFHPGLDRRGDDRVDVIRAKNSDGCRTARRGVEYFIRLFRGHVPRSAGEYRADIRRAEARCFVRVGDPGHPAKLNLSHADSSRRP